MGLQPVGHYLGDVFQLLQDDLSPLFGCHGRDPVMHDIPVLGYDRDLTLQMFQIHTCGHGSARTACNYVSEVPHRKRPS